MKEKKQRGGGAGPGGGGVNGGPADKEEEKNGLEKFEDEFKGTIFNVLYVLLKDDETSHWKYILEILLDFVQIYHYSFARFMAFPWKSDSVLTYLQTFLEFFHVSTWYNRLDITAFLAIFYLCIAVVVLVILDVFYVSYSYSQKKFAFVWPIQALRTISSLFVTVLFLPFLETFTTMLRCDSKGQMSLFPDVTCWQSTHIIHATFAIIVSIIFILIAIVVSLTYFESRSTSNDLTAKVTSRADVFIVIMKTILLYVFSFLTRKQFHWFVIALLIVLSMIAYFNYRTNWPYYNDKMNVFFCALTGIFLWGNLVLFLAKVLETTRFSGALQLYFLGLPLVVGLVIFDRDDRVQLLLTNINNFQRGEDVAHQIRYFLHLLNNAGKEGQNGMGTGSGGSSSSGLAGNGSSTTDRKNAIILKGYVFHHEDSCPNNDCQLKQYKTSVIQSLRNKKNTSSTQKRHNALKENTDNQALLLQHAKNMYRSGIQKFPQCTSLKIQYAFFLMDRMNKKTDALTELNSAFALNPPFDEQFLLYRYQKISEDFGDGSGVGDGHGGMDMAAKFAYENSLRQCSQHIQKSAALHHEFWNYLREDRPDISKLNECGSKINQSIVMVETYWNQLQKMNSNVPKALKLYAKFLIEILNDKEGGQDLLSRAKDASNIKQNYFDAGNLHDDMNDISSMSTNGTPCIYVAGEPDKLGLLTQCNAGACRILGYTVNEIKNHNVEKLMPEMYAKNHSRVLDDALAKGAENIPNKERLVFARNKSGYLFPVWLQLKMIQSTQMGIQFVALFKIDKKLMNANLAFVLINKERKIQGISSGCLKVLNLDIQKMRRLNANGIDIQRLAPAIFDDSGDNAGGFSQKQGAILDWHIPDFGGKKKGAVNKLQNAGHLLQNESKKIQMSGQKMQLSCHMNTISMGELGEIGWYLKLEALQDKTRFNQQKRDKEREKVKQPLFQFRYEHKTGKYIRELKDSISVDNAVKDPNFVNGVYQAPNDDLEYSTQEFLMEPGPTPKAPAEVDGKDSNTTATVEGNTTTPEEGTQAPADTSLASRDINNSQVVEDLFDRRRRWGKGIQIYRLIDGKFQPKELDEEIKKQQLLEDERRRKKEEEEMASQNADAFKNNIKSRKALQMAINDKSTPPAIRNLRLTMNLVIMALLALSITEYTIISSQFKDINENFNLIQQSYGRISEVQRIAYNVRSLIMINEGKQVVYQNYTTQKDYVEYVKNDIESALNNLYELQNSISLTSLTMSERQRELTDTKSVKLYFKEHGSTLKNLKFSLTEAVLQISSAVFTARHLNLKAYSEQQEDIFFITYNVFNDFLEQLRKSSQYFVEDLASRTVEKNQLILILFLISIGTLVITMAILCPVVGTVNQARLKVLSLFVDIPNHHVIALSNKCERFLSSFNDSEHNDDAETNETDSLKVDDSDVTALGQSKRSGHKQPKNSQGSNRKVFIQFGVGVLCIMAYFVTMFAISIQYIKNIEIITYEMNVLAQAESYYSFAQNVQREMIYNKEKPILNGDSFMIAKDTIAQLYTLNQMIIEDHFHNRDILNSDYKDTFKSLYQDNLCQKKDFIQLNLIPFKCETFVSSAPTQGLQSMLMRYFETLKETLKIYINYEERGWNPLGLLNSNYFLELYIIQFRFIQDSFRSFVNVLKTSTNGEFQSIIDTRMAAFIIFIIALAVAYLILWTPFVNRLNREIWRTKSMLTIIPIEVIMKIPRIQEFLHSQSFFQSKGGSNGGNGGAANQGHSGGN